MVLYSIIGCHMWLIVASQLFDKQCYTVNFTLVELVIDYYYSHMDLLLTFLYYLPLPICHLTHLCNLLHSKFIGNLAMFYMIWKEFCKTMIWGQLKGRVASHSLHIYVFLEFSFSFSSIKHPKLEMAIINSSPSHSLINWINF